MNILTDVLAEEVKNYLNQWKIQKEKISEELPPEQHHLISDLDERLLLSVNNVLEEFSNLTLTLAVAGTTSGGKSTLVNFLCGAEIMPSSVQEMSNGLVFIEHSETKSIQIHSTSGALWDCGHWKNVTDAEIHARLSRIMDKYIQAKCDGSSNLSSPRVTVHYPLRVHTDVLQLPNGIKTKVIDLPGLSSVDNTENLELLRNVGNTFYFINFNCAETDRQKTNRLTQEIIGGLVKSYRQVVFAFNRADVFRADEDWRASEQNFIKRTMKDVKKLINSQPPDNISKLKIQDNQVLKISALPALMSLFIGNHVRPKHAHASDTLSNRFGFLLSDQLSETLPRDFENWTALQCSNVAKEVWEAAYADDFQNQFKSFIDQNLAYLLISEKTRKFRSSIQQDLSAWTKQFSSPAFTASHKDAAEKSASEITMAAQHFASHAEEVLGLALENLMGRSNRDRRLLTYQWYFLRIFGLSHWSCLTHRS
jgi:hypothetical protein